MKERFEEMAMNIFNADRTKYVLPGGLAELIDDARSILGDEFNEFDSQQTGEVLAKHLKGLNEISLSDFMALFDRLRSTRRIKSNAELAADEEERESEPVIEDDPRSEFEIFYDTKTAREIRERIAVEPAFAKYARARMVAEVQQSGDGIDPTRTGACQRL
jgi:hypothetical protein